VFTKKEPIFTKNTDNRLDWQKGRGQEGGLARQAGRFSHPHVRAQLQRSLLDN
jgi:hypothetical protein